MNEDQGISRRTFVKVAAAGSALAGFNVGRARGDNSGQSFKIGLIGCGGRGNGATRNCMEAGKILGVGIKVVAVADAMEDRARGSAKRYGVEEGKCFVGFDAYKKVLEQDVDIVLMATPPNFRPIHFAATVEAGKHAFIEKPVAVDPPGARSIIAAGERAQEKGLAVVAGTQRRHDARYQAVKAALDEGLLGRIVGGVVSWNGSKLWYKTRNPGEADASYMVRNWTSFAEMSGDHVVEQHVHNLDIANWFIGHPPQTAIGFGGRGRRVTGDQFDFFSADLDYGEGTHIHSMCRQVSGCYNRIAEFFNCEKGETWGSGNSKLRNGAKVQLTVQKKEHGNGQVQEHVDLLQSILDEKPLNEARNVAESTLTALMCRISAYTGQLVRWKDVADPATGSPFGSLTLKPSALDFEAGVVTAPADNVVPIPGKA